MDDKHPELIAHQEESFRDGMAKVMFHHRTSPNEKARFAMAMIER